MTTTEGNEKDVPWLLGQLVAAIDRMERRQRLPAADRGADEPYISATELACQTSLSARHLRRLTTDPAHRIGVRVLFLRSEFDQWVRERDARQARPSDRAYQIALAIRGHRR